MGTLIVSVNEKIAFDPDSPALKSSFTQYLLKLSAIFNKVPDKIIRVTGHTASVSASSWPSSWDLGASRSIAVVRFLQEKGGIDPQRLLVSTRGEYHPIAPNDTEANKQRNRRVQFILMDHELFDLNDLQPLSMK
jgi:chemotaxis protein MotB